MSVAKMLVKNMHTLKIIYSIIHLNILMTKANYIFDNVTQNFVNDLLIHMRPNCLSLHIDNQDLKQNYRDIQTLFKSFQEILPTTVTVLSGRQGLCIYQLLPKKYLEIYELFWHMYQFIANSIFINLSL